MVDNQHRKITGFRDLTEAEIALMNRIKALGEQAAALYHEVYGLPDTDKRCANIARTELQDGFMWLVRGVARPDDPFDRPPVTADV
ncbi:hypothetical protein [Saccharothrix sp. HUAS TT1]|uniref:Acb2/Tad1 domain-containing protein n=1 Tax=unclassified Saccharothrix TaxID=2593673 RepID=UPI00345BAC1D